MMKPGYVRAGDRVRLISPSGWVAEEKVLPAVKLLEDEGFEVIPGDHLFTRHFRFAGSDGQRLADLQQAFDDPLCKAVICSRGGYGSIRIAGKINFGQFRESPKWLVGFSDITVLHACLQKEGFCSIHGAMPAFYLDEGRPHANFLELMTMLKGGGATNSLPAHPFNRPGNATGKLTGGNLSLLFSLIGTPMEPFTDGTILFIEDLSEYLYHLDRMMHSLKLSGKLRNLKALLVGDFTGMNDNDSPFGQSVEEIILNVVGDYSYPVCFGFPAGHSAMNRPLMLGADYSLTMNESQVSFNLVP